MNLRTFVEAALASTVVIGAGFVVGPPLDDPGAASPALARVATTGPRLFRLGETVAERYGGRRGVVVGEYECCSYRVRFADRDDVERISCGCLRPAGTPAPVD